MPENTAVVNETTEPVKAEAAPAKDAGTGKPRSLWSDAWHDLRRSPLFITSAVLILVLLSMAVFPSLWTDGSPTEADLANKYLKKPEWGALFQPEWFGYDIQGRSVYNRVIYGARASITVGVMVTLIVTFLGTVIGMLAGYFGGILDTLLSRLTDIFFGIPFLLGALVILTAFEKRSVWVVILAISFLGWTSMARVARGAVIQVKQTDYILAAKALGASTFRILTRHVLPNALAPIIVVATTALGGYIATEATLSFLGVGLQEPLVSWGVDVAGAFRSIRNAPYVLIMPSVLVSITVLSFLMFGDAVRNALDPKLR
ncbi:MULTISPECIES: ABC transporter permease [Streptomyces]|uniref:ABC transporter permease n=1 Tax=Streptomyces chilikensis TaxID=1194079 RepID=A0ABV3EKI6_9ACTN|nr:MULTISPECIES: ABC transporter permease [Streptomyces]MDH6225168.1 oligopeptide transport system permease protein [Streptomyces sp. MJP52]